MTGFAVAASLGVISLITMVAAGAPQNGSAASGDIRPVMTTGAAQASPGASQFCCPAFIEGVTRQIRRHWDRRQPATGTTVLTFTIRRDGRIVDVVTETSSGVAMLDAASIAALPARLSEGLPAAYSGTELVLHMTFPYQR